MNRLPQNLYLSVQYDLALSTRVSRLPGSFNLKNTVPFAFSSLTNDSDIALTAIMDDKFQEWIAKNPTGTINMFRLIHYQNSAKPEWLVQWASRVGPSREYIMDAPATNN